MSLQNIVTVYSNRYSVAGSADADAAILLSESMYLTEIMKKVLY